MACSGQLSIASLAAASRPGGHLGRVGDGVTVVVHVENLRAQRQAHAVAAATVFVDGDLHRHLLGEVEFQMQLGEPAQDVGRNVLVATVSGRAVVRLADPDVGGAVEQPLEPDPGFGAGQRRAGAAVDAAAEGQVLTGVLAVGIERVRILEAARIAVGRPVDHHQRAAGADGFLADGGRHPRQPEVALDRALDAQALLDEVRQQAAVLAQPALDVRAVPDHLQRGAQQPDRGLLPGGEDVGGDPHDVADLRHRPVRECRRRQSGQHVVAGLGPAVLDVGREDLVEVLQRRLGQRLVGVAETAAVGATGEPLEQLGAVLVRHAKQVGDDAQRERARRNP